MPANYEFRDMFKIRTRNFALDVIKLFQNLPKTYEAKHLGGQLLRASSSIASNYRAACRARSSKEFYSKISIVVEESDEAEFWLSMLIDSHIHTDDEIIRLHKESLELLKIISKARKTASERKN